MKIMETETRARIARPFKTLEELYSNLDKLTPWPDTVELRESTEYVFSAGNAETLNEKLDKLDRDQQPKTICCHDMKGGYLEDRFIDGSDAHDAYVFYNWNVIDTFIYFSHHLVTIPPYGWINAAHRHGVKVLGTIITEHGFGVQVWEKVFSTTEETEKFANALVQIAKFYGFEGWLLNVENTIKREDVSKLLYFVRFLTNRIHEELEGSEIIWYDSVTCTGELNWQNQLNDQNSCYFLSCDGIFLNYNWSEKRLADSLAFARKENRERDVYVGLDVWGRGCPGGGGFNSAFALDIIRKAGLSVAIFAHGWTHEYFGSAYFYRIEDIFWAQLMPYLYVHVPIIESEPFVSSFCRGIGKNYYRCGVISYEEQGSSITGGNGNPFFNLNKQKHQVILPLKHSRIIDTTIIEEDDNVPGSDNNPPIKEDNPSKKNEIKKIKEYIYETGFDVMKVKGQTVTFRAKSPAGMNFLEFQNDFAFDGGGCLKFIIKDPSVHYRLFLVHIDFSRDIQASVIYRMDNEEAHDPNEGFRNNLCLILGNDFTVETIVPVETIALDSGWKKR
ncbi:cytosolic endo-beta-N-acetylglucosaminidase isoform X1 [Belonocnema kinseyi]|uniref:cytosolic endo-beta-N-acetylglucosaminidase isoform X1 n=1 Tax=Belonocnema kinseyi TaxID=2817044 RepID=UPI00143DED82|nr:cytosolic endo-beta-N-acetylglucosaminidase isoform X1 [Belonocnema kinseyi]XP_033221918.1 cytosolic endo-beta-N-acetylglucosaminidase isoform X1 [Belonocnema kinseyi]XP_033221919.1 cytosolic endo-beta-N-acetylglucosaminidase isoform X1 [Belonocnema kinseyi]